ncbi:MAG: hypothetical protein JW908_12460 [Anaerolineales bacterium]|nr:hypothetical protein [Anaerolineales bacterium]
MQRIFTHTCHIPGTLGADLDIRFTLPCDAQLLHVSAVGSNTSAAGITLGNSDTAAAYMAKKAVGVSGSPLEFDRDDFLDSQFPHISQGTVFVAALDHDFNGGGSASASADITLVCTFSEG